MAEPKYTNITVHLTDRGLSPFRMISAVASAMMQGGADLYDVQAVSELAADDSTLDELRKWVLVK